MSTPCFWKYIWHHGIKILGIQKTDPIATSQSWSVDKGHLCFTQMAEAKYYVHISWCHRLNAWCRELGGRENHTWLFAASESRRNEDATFLHSNNYRRNASDIRYKYAEMMFVRSCSMTVDYDLKSFHTHTHTVNSQMGLYSDEM